MSISTANWSISLDNDVMFFADNQDLFVLHVRVEFNLVNGWLDFASVKSNVIPCCKNLGYMQVYYTLDH